MAGLAALADAKWRLMTSLVLTMLWVDGGEFVRGAERHCRRRWCDHIGCAGRRDLLRRVRSSAGDSIKVSTARGLLRRRSNSGTGRQSRRIPGAGVPLAGRR